MKRYIALIIRHRIIVLAVALAISLLSGFIASKGTYSSSIPKLIFGENHKGYKEYKKRIIEFTNDEMIIFIYKDNNIFSEKSIARLEKVVEKIQENPEVRRVDSLLNAQHTYSKEDTLYIEKYVDQARNQPENIDRILKNITTDSMYKKLIVSEDGEHAALIIELDPTFGLTSEHIGPLEKKILKVFDQAGFKAENLHRVGIVSSISDVVTQAAYNINRLFPIGCILLLIVVFVMFQRLWPVAITLGVSFIGVLWTVGFAVILDRQISIFVSLAPAIIMIVATSDIIHLCSAYLLELAKGKSKEEAILISGIEVGTACFWTSVTTFIGFISLTLVPAPMMKQMGLVLGFGVAVSLLLAMTLTPIFFSFLKKPEPHTYDASKAQAFLSRLLFGVKKATFHKSKLIFLLFLIILGFSIHGSTRVNIDTDFYKRFDEESRSRKDEAYYHKHFAGSNFLEIFIDSKEKEGILVPELFARTTEFQNQIKALPEVDDVLSFVNLIKNIDEEMNPEHAQNEPDTWSGNMLAQYLLLFEMSGGEDLDRLMDFDRSVMRMNVRLSENGTQFSYSTGNKVKKIADETFNNTADVEVTGLMYLFGGFVDVIIRGQIQGLCFAFFTIMAVMMLMFRSVKIGFWSMFPNILPLLVLGGYLGYSLDAVDSDTITIAMVAVGIGVDDTIHFLSRLRFESARTTDPEEALKNALQFSGRAMITTTIILSAGFLPLGLSDYYSVAIFGSLLPMTLVVAVVADILLIPAMVRLGFIQFPLKNEGDMISGYEDVVAA